MSSLAINFQPFTTWFRYQYQQRKEGLLPRTPDNLFSPQKIRCHHPKCPKVLNNHCGISRSSASKMTNIQEHSKQPNNQINTIQSSPLNNSNNHDNISSDNSEIQSLNNTLSATMDEKQKMLLLKIANNSIAAASAVASVADNDYGNVSVLMFFFFLFFFLLICYTTFSFFPVKNNHEFALFQKTFLSKHSWFLNKFYNKFLIL